MTRCLKLLPALALLLLVAADAPDPPASEKQALARLQGLIGDWRGVGQPRRGSTRGAWRESCDWAWKFADRQTTLEFAVDQAKFFRQGSLRYDARSEKYELTARGPGEGPPVKFAGTLDDDGKLVLVAEQASPDGPARISIRQVAGGDRLVVLYEKRSRGDRYLRLAEVGYTRQGSNFGQGASFIECVVTGGVGTIPVSYQGNTYYVCCGGCRDYFNEDPAAVLAEYRQRQAEEKTKRQQKK